MRKVEERFFRWVLGAERCMPRYLVREELPREELRGRGNRRAWRFEKRLEKGRGSEMTRRYWEEMKERLRGKSEIRMGEGEQNIL